MGNNIDRIYDFCLNKVRSNPKIANSPMGQEYIRILESRDTAAGMRMADNICHELGTDQQTFARNLLSRR